jgi:capsid protein
MWKQLQGWYIETVKRPVYEWWLSRALISDPDLRRLPYSQFEKFNAPMFFGRRWEWVDPKSDIAALREAVALGIKSRAEIIRERGRDPDEVWAELDAEEGRGFAAPRPGGQPAPVRPADDQE